MSARQLIEELRDHLMECAKGDEKRAEDRKRYNDDERSYYNGSGSGTDYAVEKLNALLDRLTPPTADREASDSLLNAAKPFAFLNAPHLFQSQDGGCTSVLVEDADVQRLRALFKLTPAPVEPTEAMLAAIEDAMMPDHEDPDAAVAYAAMLKAAPEPQDRT